MYIMSESRGQISAILMIETKCMPMMNVMVAERHKPVISFSSGLCERIRNEKRASVY